MDRRGGKAPIAGTGNINIERKTVTLERVIGEETKQVTVRNTVTFPVAVKKVKDVTADVIDLTSEVLGERKIVVEGTLHKQIGWVPDVTQEVDGVLYEEGGVYDLPFNDNFTAYVEFERVPNDAQVVLDARVEYVDHNQINNTQWEEVVIIELFVKATEVVEVKVITDINAPGMNLEVCKETFNVAGVIGTAETQVNVSRDYEFPEGTEVAKVKEATARIKDITTELLPGKVIVKGTLHKQIFYVEAVTRRLYETSVNEMFTAQVEIPGVQPGMEADVTANARVEYMDLDFRPGAEGEPDRVHQTAILAITVRVTKDMQIKIVTMVEGANIHVETEKIDVEKVIGRGQKQEIVRDSGITFPRPVRKIGDIDARVDINRQETTVLPNKVVIEAALHKQVYYVGLCDDAVWEKSFDEPFTTFVDIKGAKPGQSVNVRGKVETVNIEGPQPHYPADVCTIFENPPAEEENRFNPANYPWQQSAIVQLLVRVTESEEIKIVTNVTLGAYEPPKKPEEEEQECPEGNGNDNNGDSHKPSMRYYTIRPGDTLWKIAKRYGTTVETLMALNPGIDPQNLQIGQKIRIS